MFSLKVVTKRKEHKERIHALCEIAQRALIAYPFSPLTFRVEYHGKSKFHLIGEQQKQRFVLTIYYPDSQWGELGTLPAIESLLLWMTALAQDMPGCVPVPITNRIGHVITEVDFDNRIVYCQLLSWVFGRQLWVDKTPLPQRFPSDTVRQLGHLVAYLHQHASQWEMPQGFTRPRWLLDPSRFIDKFRQGVQNGEIATEDFKAIIRATDKMMPLLNAMRPTRQTWGIVHADIHWANCVFSGNEIRLFDFESCGFGYFIRDLAEPLKYTPAASQRQAMVKAYSEIRYLSDNDYQLLFAYLIASRLSSWFQHIGRPEPPSYVTQAAQECQQYISGQPLFTV